MLCLWDFFPIIENLLCDVSLILETIDLQSLYTLFIVKVMYKSLYTHKEQYSFIF